jgi:hypothetical protein
MMLKQIPKSDEEHGNRKDVEWKFREAYVEAACGSLWHKCEAERLENILRDTFGLSEQAIEALKTIEAGGYDTDRLLESTRREIAERWSVPMRKIAKTRRGVEGQYRHWVCRADFDATTQRGVESALYRAGVYEAVLRDGCGYDPEQIDAVAKLAWSERGGA